MSTGEGTIALVLCTFTPVRLAHTPHCHPCEFVLCIYIYIYIYIYICIYIYIYIYVYSPVWRQPGLQSLGEIVSPCPVSILGLVPQVSPRLNASVLLPTSLSYAGIGFHDLNHILLTAIVVDSNSSSKISVQSREMLFFTRYICV